MKLFSLTLISVVCCFLSSCDGHIYDMSVKTWDIGTNCPVYFSLIGSEGFLPLTRLRNNDSKTAFQPGQTDRFVINGQFGTVLAIGFQLDCTGIGKVSEWFMEEVYLGDDESLPQYFSCNALFSTSPGQETDFRGCISRKGYRVNVETGNEEDAGTYGKVYITLLGSLGESCKIRLNHKGKFKFQPGRTDTFYINPEKIGIVSKIRIELDNTEESNSPNWFLKTVSLQDLRRNRVLPFPWNQWLTPTEDQKTISVEIPLSTDKKEK